jgi:hypothetical protein
MDRSVMAHLSGGVQTQLYAALRYLALVTDESVPTERMAKLVFADVDERKRVLADTLRSAYRFLFEDGLDLERATSQQIHERFVDAGASGDTVRKCIAFFVSAARDAGLTISPHIQVTKGGRPRTKAGPKARPQSAATKAHEKTREYADRGVDARNDWERMLLEKFPEFDPSWSEEAKAEWLKAFNELVSIGRRGRSS